MPYKDPAKKREHHRLYMRIWYQRNKRAHVQRVTSRRQRMVDYYQNLKRHMSCGRCGESHPACLEFHHRNPAEKEFDISQARRGSFTMERLLAEIAKCEALCANCHLKLHWELREAKRNSA